MMGGGIIIEITHHPPFTLRPETTNIIKDGDIATFIYDGTQYQLIALDNESRISTNTSDIAKNAAAIEAINNTSTGILAQAKSYVDNQIPSSLPANGGNADTIGGIVDAYHMGSIRTDGSGYGTNYQLYSQFNKYSDNRFGLGIVSSDLSYEVRTDYATNADTVDGIHITCANDAANNSWVAAFSSSAELRAISPDRLISGYTYSVISNVTIGSTNATYNTILDFAIASTGYKIATIIVIVASGYPSDIPEQGEALVSVMNDIQNIRKIVTVEMYRKDYPPTIYKRSIFNGSWHDSKWYLASYGAIKHEQITASTNSNGIIQLPTSYRNYVNVIIKGFGAQVYTDDSTGLEVVRVFRLTSNESIPNTVVSMDIVYYDYTYGGN